MVHQVILIDLRQLVSEAFTIGKKSFDSPPFFAIRQIISPENEVYGAKSMNDVVKNLNKSLS